MREAGLDWLTGRKRILGAVHPEGRAGPADLGAYTTPGAGPSSAGPSVAAGVPAQPGGFFCSLAAGGFASSCFASSPIRAAASSRYRKAFTSVVPFATIQAPER